MGRLFDGVSAILGLSYYNTHQAESAQMLEYSAWQKASSNAFVRVPIIQEAILRIDWRPLIRELAVRYLKNEDTSTLAAMFHRSITEAAMQVIEVSGTQKIVMAGGVFCNRFLTERLLCALEHAGLSGYIHSQLPPTDGSLSAGQIWVAAHQG
jgi:hydrogenase maturation protein HypF